MIVRSAARAALLVTGAAVIVAAASYMLSHVNDRAVFTVLVPGVVVGLILIGVSIRIGSISRTR